MPLEQTENGLVIQTVQEVVDDFNTDFKDPDTGFGADTNTQPNSGLGIIIGIMSERIVLLQQMIQTTQTEFSGDATGVNLDVISELTGTFRNGERQSRSDSGNIIGTPSTSVPNLSQIRNTTTQEVWNIVDGPYIIGGFGSVLCNMQAVLGGEARFEAATVWEIVTPVSGWTSFATVADIDPEDVGQLLDDDATLQQRRRDEIFINGNDLSAVKASVLKVNQVIFAAVFENRDCTQAVNGIPPGAFETVVEGGADQEIIEAIYAGPKPPGAVAFGQTFTGIVTDIEGNDIDIGFTRVADINILLEVTVTTLNAEIALPENAEQTIIDSVLLFANKEIVGIGQDLRPQQLEQAVWPVLQGEETTKYAATGVVVLASIDPAAVDAALISIDDRSRADYDSTRITVVFI